MRSAKESSSLPRRFALLTVLVLAFAGLLVIGCGSEDQSTTDTDRSSDAGTTTEFDTDVDSALPPNVITQQEIDDQEEGSPERALLEWWLAFQFRDTAKALELTDEGTLESISDKKLVALVQQVGSGLPKLVTLESDIAGDDAAIRVLIQTFTPEKDGTMPERPTATSPLTLNMSNKGGEWAFADTAYLRTLLENNSI